MSLTGAQQFPLCSVPGTCTAAMADGADASIALVEPARAQSAAADALHIVHVVLRLDVGGLERVVVDLARTGLVRGHQVTVLCLERPGELAASVEAAGARVVSLEKPPGRPRHLARQLRDTIRALRPSVLHTHHIGALWYVGKARAGVRVVHTEHTDSIAIERRLSRKVRLYLLSKLAARYASTFCCVSDSIAEAVIRRRIASRKATAVVVNGIDIARYQQTRSVTRSAVRAELGILADALVIGTVGRLNEVKRQDLLLRSAASLMTDLPHVHLLLVGDGPERQRLEQLARELRSEPRITFAGYQASPERYLAAMDVFALSSRLEGLPLSLLEAWATGLPVVSTAVGGIPSVVTDRSSGLLVPADDHDALANALRQVLNDDALAETLAVGGLAAVTENYALECMADRYESYYRRAVQ